MEQLPPSCIIAGYFKVPTPSEAPPCIDALAAPLFSHSSIADNQELAASFLFKAIPRTAGLLPVLVGHVRRLKGLPPAPQTRLARRSATFMVPQS